MYIQGDTSNINFFSFLSKLKLKTNAILPHNSIFIFHMCVLIFFIILYKSIKRSWKMSDSWNILSIIEVEITKHVKGIVNQLD